MGAYLVDNPPRIRQFRPRRAALWPVVGVHTAESFPDETGPDTGAENVAAFIQRRTTPGSYHCLSDSDSRIQLVPFDQAAYHIGTHGLNDRTIGISAATQAAKWNSLDDHYADAMVRNMARDAADAARWLKAQHGLTVPARRISLSTALNGGAGFLAHGDADPERRTDPGKTFPWNTFLAYYAALMAGSTPTPPEDDDVTPEQITAAVRVAVHGLFDEAANRSTPTGRQLADDIVRIVGNPATTAQAVNAFQADGDPYSLYTMVKRTAGATGALPQAGSGSSFGELRADGGAVSTED